MITMVTDQESFFSSVTFQNPLVSQIKIYFKNNLLWSRDTAQ